LRGSAWRWLLKASVDARSRHVLRRAQRNAQESLDLAASDTERCSSLEALGEAYAADSRGDLAWQYLREAALVADGSPDIPDDRPATLLARACELPGRWPGSMRGAPPEPEVRALIDRGLALVPADDQLGRARLLATRAGWPFAFPESVREEDLDG